MEYLHCSDHLYRMKRLNTMGDTVISSVDELVKLVNKLPESEVNLARHFLQFLIEKARQGILISDTVPETPLQNKKHISLQGITSGSNLTEEDFAEVAQIWQ